MILTVTGYGGTHFKVDTLEPIDGFDRCAFDELNAKLPGMWCTEFDDGDVVWNRDYVGFPEWRPERYRQFWVRLR